MHVGLGIDIFDIPWLHEFFGNNVMEKAGNRDSEAGFESQCSQLCFSDALICSSVAEAALNALARLGIRPKQLLTWIKEEWNKATQRAGLISSGKGWHTIFWYYWDDLLSHEGCDQKAWYKVSLQFTAKLIKQFCHYLIKCRLPSQLWIDSLLVIASLMLDANVSSACPLFADIRKTNIPCSGDSKDAYCRTVNVDNNNMISDKYI